MGTQVRIDNDELYPYFFICLADESTRGRDCTTMADDDTLARWQRVQHEFEEMQTELRKIDEADRATR